MCALSVCMCVTAAAVVPQRFELPLYMAQQLTDTLSFFSPLHSVLLLHSCLLPRLLLRVVCVLCVCMCSCSHVHLFVTHCGACLAFPRSKLVAFKAAVSIACLCVFLCEHISCMIRTSSMQYSTVYHSIIHKLKRAKNNSQPCLLLLFVHCSGEKSHGTSHTHRCSRLHHRNMAATTVSKSHKTSVCIIADVQLWPAIQRIREKHDRSFVRWMPHINMYDRFIYLRECCYSGQVVSLLA